MTSSDFFFFFLIFKMSGFFPPLKGKGILSFFFFFNDLQAQYLVLQLPEPGTVTPAAAD